jgi:predicted hotdog family 3-hydroxylacyl-ACP dehydratase
MTRADLPTPAEVVPHSGEMVLLSSIERHEPGTTACSVRIAQCALFRDAHGELPSWVGIELMAQCIAVHAGMLGRAQGLPPRIGFLLGARRVSFHRPRFGAGETVDVTATHVWGGDLGMVAFDCTIVARGSGELLADARLNCFLPREGELMEGIA